MSAKGKVHHLNRRIVATIDADRLRAAKRAFTVRNVPVEQMNSLVHEDVAPSAGDLVLARVDEIGFIERLQRVDGRRARLFEGDEIVVCYGDRYAPRHVEALVPENLDPCNLAAAGGIAGHVTAWHESITIWQTRITPLGLVARSDGKILNLRDYALDPAPRSNLPPVIVVAGTSMSAGKTRTASGIALGLVRAGHRVAAIKITGTGSGGDLWAMRDAGAAPVLDFTDAGFASSYRLEEAELERIFRLLSGQAAAAGATVIVAEVADGLHHADSATMLRLAEVKSATTGVLFAAADSLGAAAGVDWLRKEGYRLLGISGRLCMAPLLVREVEAMSGGSVGVLRPEELETASVAAGLLTPGDTAAAK